MKRFAVILSGCGVFDGSEIHEATLSLYAIMKNGGSYTIFAPNIEQHHVINHITGEEMPESRNVLVESTRIARGDIHDLTEYRASDYDILLLPGGFGAAKNLSDFAFKGANMNVNSLVANAVLETYKAGKPIGALCIAPVIFAHLFKDVELTIGSDQGTIEAIEKLGGKHVTTTHGEVVVDKKYKLATTPCYMLDANILQIAEGADHVVKALIDLCS